MCLENSEKLKVFVSFPMYGKTKDEIHAMFRWVKSLLKKRDPDKEYEILDTWFEEDAPEDIEPRVYYLIKSLKLLKDADMVVFTAGCFRRLSCVIEYWASDTLGLPTFPIKIDDNGDVYIPKEPAIAMNLEYQDDYYKIHQKYSKELVDLKNDVIRTLLDRF